MEPVEEWVIAPLVRIPQIPPQQGPGNSLLDPTTTFAELPALQQTPLPLAPSITPPDWLLNLSASFDQLPAIQQTPLPPSAPPDWLLDLSTPYAQFPSAEPTPRPQPVPPDWLLKLSPTMARLSASTSIAPEQISTQNTDMLDVSAIPELQPRATVHPTEQELQPALLTPLSLAAASVDLPALPGRQDQALLTQLPLAAASALSRISPTPASTWPSTVWPLQDVHLHAVQARAATWQRTRRPLPLQDMGMNAVQAPMPHIARYAIPAYEPFVAKRHASSTGETLMGCGLLLALGILALFLLYYLSLS